ncbi:hypothetical protein [Henriciella sp.]
MIKPVLAVLLAAWDGAPIKVRCPAGRERLPGGHRPAIPVAAIA